MPLIILTNTSLRLAIDADLGASIADFSIRGPHNTFYPLMRRASPGETNASLLSSFFMAPWVNRIAGAAFDFQGNRIALKPTTPADTAPDLVVAQHGDVRKRPWRLITSSLTSATLEFDSRQHEHVNWPWSFRARTIYTLTPDALTIDLDLTNTDTSPFPAGLGHHPYFPRTLFRADDEIEVSLPVAGRYTLKNACAIGPASDDAVSRTLRAGLIPLPRTPFDDVFTTESSIPNIACLRWPQSNITLAIEASENMKHWVLYAPFADGSPAPFIAVEPQTQVNAALNHEQAEWTGTTILAPIETLSTRVRFRVSS
jgi:aldose 1-epimerase